MRRAKKILIVLLTIFLMRGALAPQFLHADEYEPLPEPVSPILGADLALVVDAATGTILYQHGDPHTRALPASITKIMTALLLLESGAAMDDGIFHSNEAVFAIPRDSSHIAMNPVETLTVEEALYAIMLPSANDVSNAIAEFVAGDMDEFARQMTARARELGAVNTNFTNAHGLPHANHYTTPYDMYLIMREAIRHEKFLEVINTPRFLIPPTPLQPSPRIIDNTNLMVRPTSHQFTLDIVGGKTGWTTPSGHTLVSYARRDGTGLITVVMAASQREFIFNDTRELMNFGFEQFETHEIFNPEDFDAQINLVQRNRDGVIIIGNLPLLAERGMTLALPKNISIYDVDIELILPDRLTAPVAENFPAGSVIARYNGQILDSVDIMTARGGTALSAEALTAVAVAQGASAGYEQLPQNFLAALLGNYDFQYLPEWLESLDTISIVLAVIAIVISLILAIKFLKFKKPRSKRGRYKNHSKKFKSNIAKNYKYR